MKFSNQQILIAVKQIFDSKKRDNEEFLGWTLTSQQVIDIAYKQGKFNIENMRISFDDVENILYG